VRSISLLDAARTDKTGAEFTAIALSSLIIAGPARQIKPTSATIRDRTNERERESKRAIVMLNEYG
jgi:hypothetical protein